MKLLHFSSAAEPAPFSGSCFFKRSASAEAPKAVETVGQDEGQSMTGAAGVADDDSVDEAMARENPEEAKEDEL